MVELLGHLSLRHVKRIDGYRVLAPDLFETGTVFLYRFIAPPLVGSPLHLDHYYVHISDVDLYRVLLSKARNNEHQEKGYRFHSHFHHHLHLKFSGII